MGKGEFKGHAPRPECGSKDNLAVYSDGVYCMGSDCGFSDSVSDKYINSIVKTTSSVSSEFTLQGTRSLQRSYRGITTNSFDKYGVLCDSNHNLIFQHFNGGVVSLVKYAKTSEKGFWFKGDIRSLGLWGKHTCRSTKRLIITEGELDATSAHQMTGYDSVSIPSGCKSAERYIKKDIAWLSKYSDIVLCFDNDEPGQKAQTKVATLLPPGAARLMVLPGGFKDANDMLVSDRTNEFRSAYYAAAPLEYDDLLMGEALLNRTLDFLEDDTQVLGMPTGYEGLDKLIGGWRPGEVHTIIGGTGVGKPTLVRNLAYHQVNAGNGVLYAPLEDITPAASARFIESFMGKSLIRERYKLTENDKAHVLEFLSNLIIWDKKGRVPLDEFIKTVLFVSRAYDVKIVVLDHITAMTNGSDHAELERAIEMLKMQVALTIGVTVFVVSHMNRDNTDKDDNRPSISRAKGSSSIAQYSDTVCGVARDRATDTMRLTLLKNNRLWGEAGNLNFRFDHNIHQLVEAEEYGEAQEFEASDEFLSIFSEGIPSEQTSPETNHLVSSEGSLPSLEEFDPRPSYRSWVSSADSPNHSAK